MQPGSGVRAARREYWASVMRAAAVVVVLASAAPGGEAMTFAYGNAYEILTPGTGNQGVDVTWASVPLLSEASTGYVPLPSGCECLDLAQTAETCTAFTCHETCNLNIGECDEYCCSDPDCTADDVERFNALGQCLPDGSSTDSRLCVDTTSLDQVNEKYNMYVEQDDNALEGLVCVSVENNAIEGEFYSSQADLVNNYAVLDSEAYQSSYSFAISADSDAETGSQEYLFGDNLVAAIQADSFRAAWGGVLSLPTAGVDGTCSPQNFVEFGTDVQVNECILPVKNLEALCTQAHGPLSTALYGEDLYIGTRPSSAINTPSTDWERVTVRSLLYKSLETGSVSSWESGSTSSPTAQPTSEPTALSTVSPTESSPDANSTESLSPTVAPSASPTDAPSARRALQVASVPSTTWDASSGTCENAVVGVKYVIEHNALGVITNVQVDLTLSNVDLSRAAQTAQQGLTQSFHVSFVNTESVADSTAPERVVSGNPGYIVGLPVQAGNLVRQNAGTDDEKTAVSYLPEGLALMAASGPRGACFSSSSSPWYNLVSSTEMTASTPVLFGVDASSACSVTLTYEEFTDLSSWCIDRRNAPLLDLGATRVGIYGNANPWKAWEWVSLHRETSHLSSTAQSPVPGQLVCQNMVDRVDLEVLWTKSGEIDNPQPMILSVRAMVGQSDWQWRKTGAGVNTTQTFTFSQTVTFIEHKLTEADWFAYKPEIPPIIPAIPADVFYPFDIASAAQATLRGQKTGGHFVTAFLVCLAGLLRT